MSKFFAENLYLKKTDAADTAIHDDLGNKISEYYMNKADNKYTQVNKINVQIEESGFKEFTFDVNDLSYNYSPVEVLKLNDDGSDESVTICRFDNGDSSSFLYESELDEDDPFRTVTWDGNLSIKTSYDLGLGELTPCHNGYISTSHVIPLNRFRSKISLTVTSELNEDATNQTNDVLKLFIKDDQLVSTTGQVITDHWTSLTDFEKEVFLKNYGNSATNFSNTAVLDNDNIQIVTYTTNNEVKITGTFVGIPNKKLIIPKGLIPTNSFVSILNANIIGTKNGRATAKVVVSQDLENWYTFKFNIYEWVPVVTELNNETGRFDPELENVANSGIDIDRLSDITDWTMFNDGIAFAYLVTIEDEYSNAYIDELDLTVTMRGSWENYSKKYYAYTKGTLVVRVFDNGDYKINYKRGSN